MKKYSWQRYWHNNGDTPRISNGFLQVSEYTKNVFLLESVLDAPCLILLGEPGMGKTFEIKRIYDQQIIDEKTRKLYFNLSSFSDESRLVKRIFNSEEIKNWTNSDTKLYLYLDSLDEVLLNIKTVASLIADELNELPFERLFFRISCRTAEWSNISILDDKLKDLWEKDNFKIIHIAPLRQEDVYDAATQNGLDAEKFIGEIYDKSVQILAAKPVTLDFLLKIFKRNFTFPSLQSELYEQGCLELCTETSKSRKSSKNKGELTKEQRLRIASRIAAVMIFSNKSSILMADSIADKTDADISISELSGYFEKDNSDLDFRVTENFIRETIDTGLFTGNGTNRMKFSHQTFTEYLAAWYLDYRETPDETVIKIIGDKFLYPQLYETSAWIASRRLNIFRHLMQISPSALLRSDVISAEEDLRFDLTNRLLEVFEKEEARDDWFYGYYFKLKNSNLGEQIRPFIMDKNKGWLVRKVAIDIAESCQLIELQNELADVALDKSENRYTRINAAYAVTRIAESKTKARLKALIYEENDEHLELRGRGLAATWDENLTAEELFEALEHPPHNFYGSYSSFIDYELVKKLKVKDLPVALNWISSELNLRRSSHEFERLVDEILIMAWENLDQENIFEGFIDVAIRKINHHQDIFFRTVKTPLYSEKYIDKIDEIKKDTKNRRKIWLRVFSVIDEKHLWFLDESNFIGIGIEDIEWLAEEWKKMENFELKAKLLSQLKSFVSYWGTHPDVLSKICKVCNEDGELGREFREIFSPHVLDSDEAKKEKENYESLTFWRRQRELKQKEREEPVKPSPLERSLEFLEKFEKGEIDAWWQINWFMMFLPNGISEKSEFEEDLTEFPVWKELEESVKQRIIKGAKEYLRKGNPQTEEWIGTNTIHRPALAGYRAINLLEKFEPGFINDLDKSIWAKWSPIIYHYPIYNGSGNDNYEKHRQLIARTYEIVPNEIIKLFKQEIESKADDSYWSFEKLTYCWDEKLKKILKNILNDSNSIVLEKRYALSQLFELKDAEAEKYACKLIDFPIPEGEEAQKLLMISVELLITHGKSDCWRKIWRILSNEVEFGKRLIEFGVFRFGRLGITNLSERELADLFIWLSKQYPQSEDPVHHGVYSPGSRDEIARWRNSILDSLVERGTKESVKEVSRIKDNLPELEWLKFTLLKAEEKMREITWNPLRPKEIIKLISKKVLKIEIAPFEDKTSKIKLWNTEVKKVANLTDLLSEYKNNPDDFVFFVGAGLSVPIFPLWEKLLEKMVYECSARKSIQAKERDELYKKIKQKTKYLDIAQYCKKKLGNNYRKFLESIFDVDFPIDRISLAYQHVFKLKPGIIITTNFDQIPDRLNSLNSFTIDSQSENNSFYRIFDNQSIAEANNAWKKHPIVFKMHGCIRNHKSLVFTSDEFDEIIHNNPAMRTFLTTILGAKRVIFLGLSFSDPHIDNTLKYLRVIYGGLGTPHYALINDASNFDKETIENNYGLNVINYKSTKGHPQILEFLKTLEQIKN